MGAYDAPTTLRGKGLWLRISNFKRKNEHFEAMFYGIHPLSNALSEVTAQAVG